MNQKVLVIAMALAAAGAYVLLRHTEPAVSAGVKVLGGVASSAMADRRDADAPGVPGAPGSNQAAARQQPTVPGFSLPGGQDTASPTEVQKNEMVQNVLQGGVNADDLKMAEQTKSYLEYNQKISQILANPNVSVSSAEFRALMTQTDRMTAEHYLSLPEASGVKARLLTTQFSGTVLQEKLTELGKETAVLREQLRIAGDPSLRPDAQQRRAVEAQVWKEANSMTSYPNGMTKEQYVLSRLKP